jgi:stearoyl-CoA desaturase (Delta-9 desaturase)
LKETAATGTKPESFRKWLYFSLLIVIPTLAFLFGVYLLLTAQVSAKDLWLLFAMYMLTGLGISIGYHRMLTHKGFETYAPIRFLFLALGSMAFQGPAITWSATHKRHHSHSDTDSDLHSPKRGLLYSHFGWIFQYTKDMTKDVRDSYGEKLQKDKMAAFFDRTFIYWSLLGIIIPFLIGGWSGMLWGGLIRIFFLSHVTWSVNSICHKYGSRMFKTNDQSTNNWWIAILGFGEGWHNNHHAFPKSAFHGLRWWQFDISGILIRFFEKTGLIWNVQRVKPERIEKQLELGRKKSGEAETA